MVDLGTKLMFYVIIELNLKNEKATSKNQKGNEAKELNISSLWINEA